MSLNTASQRAFSMLRRMRPTKVAVTTNSTHHHYTNDDNHNDTKRWLQTTTTTSPAPKPTVDIAKMMPVGMAEMNNETLVTIAALCNHEARAEVLVRHIMSVDDIEYDQAFSKFEEVAQANRDATSSLAVSPYFIGIGVGMVAAFGSLPMVFDLNTALWFNEDYVTTDVPEPRDLETMLEVGSWTWNWMEPPLGALSFSLLCLQYAR